MYDELLAIWDYEGKLESKFWSQEIKRKVLSHRLASSPAKFLTSLTYKVCELFLPLWDEEQETYTYSKVGHTIIILYSPLQLEVESRLIVAQPDDAEADLSQWAMKGESEKQTHARQVLKRFTKYEVMEVAPRSQDYAVSPTCSVLERGH